MVAGNSGSATQSKKLTRNAIAAIVGLLGFLLLVRSFGSPGSGVWSRGASSSSAIVYRPAEASPVPDGLRAFIRPPCETPPRCYFSHPMESAAPCAGSGSGGDGDEAGCPWRLDRYEPSEWEKEWVDGGEDLQNIVCQVRSALRHSTAPS